MLETPTLEIKSLSNLPVTVIVSVIIVIGYDIILSVRDNKDKKS